MSSPKRPEFRCKGCGQSKRLNNNPATWTYVIQRQGFIKIGASITPEARIESFRKAVPNVTQPHGMDWLEPLYVIALYTFNVEHDLHEWFANCHVRGEWFLPDSRMKEYLTSVAAIYRLRVAEAEAAAAAEDPWWAA